MITTYKIELWNPLHNKYVPYWKGEDFKMAERMMFKPYNIIHTRRLIKTTEEVLYVEKKK